MIKIIISGKDSNQITRNSLRSCYGMVLQDSWLYNATIKDNIAYGKPDASMEEIIEASKQAGAHPFIEKMPNQINSSVMWLQSIQEAINSGIDTFIEFGNGKVLAGLNRKISAEIKTYNIYDSESLKNVVEELMVGV